MRPILFRAGLLAIALAFLAGCVGGPVRRVSEPSAQIQQMTVRADGRWDIELRLQNYSSIPMRFDSVDLALTVAGQPAGDVRATPALQIGPESADIVPVTLEPALGAKLAAADALSARRGVAYTLKGRVVATPEKKSAKTFDIHRESELNPAPGLPGVLR